MIQENEKKMNEKNKMQEEKEREKEMSIEKKEQERLNKGSYICPQLIECRMGGAMRDAICDHEHTRTDTPK